MRSLGAPAPWTLLLVAVVLQGGLAGHLRVGGYLPDFVLTVVLCLGLLTGAAPGGVIGFVGGALEGILVGASPGGFLVSRIAAGLAVGIVSERLFRENWLVPVTLVFAGTVLAELIFFFITPTFGLLFSLRLGVAEGIWNGALGALLYPLALRWVPRRDPLLGSA